MKKKKASSGRTSIVRTSAARTVKKRASSSSLTIRDVARHARVSVATVSRVLNNPGSVAETNRLRVQKTMQQLGFVPNFTASSLAKNRSGGIGLVIPNTGPVFARLLDDIEHAVRRQGSHLMVAIGSCAGEDVPQAIQFLKQRRCDALIAFPGMMSDETLNAIMDAEPNLVLLHRLASRHPDRCVLVDNANGVRIATQYLLQSGHRDIAVIAGGEDNHESRERHRAFIQTLRQAGLEPDTKLIVHGDFGAASGEQGVAQLLATGHRFSAVFCFNDEMAAGAISYLRSTGFSLPEDISIVGFDDVPFCNQIFPRLTTVQQPVVEMARIAALYALTLRNGGDLPSGPAILTPKLVIRESVAPYQPAKTPRTVKSSSTPEM